MVAGLGSGLVVLVSSAVVIGRAITAAVAASAGPVTVPPSQYWDGNDGPWSTFALQLGTPSQNVRLLPSTSGSSIWAILPQGCIPGDPADCTTRRGYTFKPNASLTWTDVGLFELPLIAERPLGYTGNGDFGFDNVTVGWQGYGGPTLEHQVVAGIATKNFSWMGMLGLTSHGTNFTDFNDPKPSLLMSFREQGLVSSSSWGYTAGASYGPKGLYGSLTFGGYDATRFAPNNMTFRFGADISWDLLVGIQGITSTGNNSSNNNINLLSSGITALIDSTIPHIWLPVEACQRFEQTFGLVWDQRTDLYLVDEALHSKLVAQAANITFKLGIGTSGGQTVDVVLPYKSFDLQVTLPMTNNSVRYFPLRRASNESQYALGRTFLQEAYVIADYDRSNFSISQARFPDADVGEKLVAIFSPSNSSNTPLPDQPPSKSTSRTRTIIGATVGALTILLLPLFFFLHRRLRRHLLASEAPTPPSRPSTPPDFQKPELDATSMIRHEAPGWRPVREIDGGNAGGVVFELSAGRGERVELATRSGGGERDEKGDAEEPGVINEVVELPTRGGQSEKPGLERI